MPKPKKNVGGEGGEERVNAQGNGIQRLVLTLQIYYTELTCLKKTYKFIGLLITLQLSYLNNYESLRRHNVHTTTGQRPRAKKTYGLGGYRLMVATRTRASLDVGHVDRTSEGTRSSPTTRYITWGCGPEIEFVGGANQRPKFVGCEPEIEMRGVQTRDRNAWGANQR